jgi:hypothetical protein
MKITLTTLLHSVLALVGYVDNSVLLTLPETQIAHLSNAPNRVKLRVKEGMSAGSLYSATKNIDIVLCKEVL